MPTNENEIVQLKDNTAARGVRRTLTDEQQKFEERTTRLSAAVQDIIDEFLTETREGMANRNDDGFSPAEARKYAKATAEVYEVVVVGLKAIKNNTKNGLDAIVGSNALIENADGTVDVDLSKLGGLLGSVSIGVQQDQLKFVSLPDVV